MRNLTVQAVVDAIDDIVSGRLQGGEAALVLLHDILFLAGEAGDIVDVADRVVWAVGSDLAGRARVHAGHLQVDADVGVVDVDDLSTAKVADVLVVTNSLCGGGGHDARSDGGGAEGGGLAEELTAALGVEGR